MIPPRFLYRKLGEKLTRFDERAGRYMYVPEVD